MAVFKKAYAIFQERGYRIRLLSAAFRNHMHWSEFIGGDVVISPPYAWQKRFNACDIEVDPAHRHARRSDDRRRAAEEVRRFPARLDEDGLGRDEFDTLRTDGANAAPVHRGVP